MAQILCTAQTDTTLTVSVIELTTNQNKRIDYYYTIGAVSSPTSGTFAAKRVINKNASDTYTYSGLQMGTTYTLYVEVYNTDDGHKISFGAYWVTATTKIPCTNYLTFNNLDGTQSTSAQLTYLNPNQNYTPSSHLPSYDSSKYILSSIIYNGRDYTGGSFTTPSSAISIYYYFTELPSSGIVPWSWSSSNGTASTAQTQRAYTAITNRGETSDFSYLVWNDLVSKVNETKVKAGLEWDSSFGSVLATKMTNSDTGRILTADRFNAVRINIDSIISSISTGLGYAFVGDRVRGQFFLDLTEALNECIYSL